MMHTERNHIPSFATSITDNSNRNQTPPCEGVKSVRFCREMDGDNRVASRLVYDRSYSAFAEKKHIFASQWQDQPPWKGLDQKRLEQQIHLKVLPLWRVQFCMNLASNQNKLRQQKRNILLRQAHRGQ